MSCTSASWRCSTALPEAWDTPRSYLQQVRRLRKKSCAYTYSKLSASPGPNWMCHVCKERPVSKLLIGLEQANVHEH
eukprot:794728-Pelagomonas_calceolata.AAC.5